MYFNIPGLKNSGDDHWQTLWEKKFPNDFIRSTNDHVVDFERAEFFADIWGSELVTIENGGHLVKSIGINNWESGITLLQKLKNHATS